MNKGKFIVACLMTAIIAGAFIGVGLTYADSLFLGWYETITPEVPATHSYHLLPAVAVIGRVFVWMFCAALLEAIVLLCIYWGTVTVA